VGDDLAVRLATGLLLTAGKQMVAITAALAGLSSDETMAASTLPRSEWVRRLANDNDATTIVRVGDAAALAVSELLIRDTAPDGWGEHQAAYLRLLSEQGGYVPTGEEEAFLQAAGRPDSPRSEE
jgi:hypothetical protein